MSEQTSERGFTTAILHSDRDAPIEHGALHKPLHVSVAYAYRNSADLIAPKFAKDVSDLIDRMFW